MHARRLQLGCLITVCSMLIVGCGEQNTTLTPGNYLLKFDQIEAAKRERPLELNRQELDTVLGLATEIDVRHPDLAGAPPGSVPDGCKWLRWEMMNEVLVVGMQEDYVVTVMRLRR